jgi:hypothetical protein
MSPRWNWDSPTPLAASECALPPGPKGGGAHSPAAKGVGESQFQRLDKRLALWAGIFKKSMGARHRVGIGLLYRPARLHRLAEFIPWNRFRGPIHVQKYQLCLLCDCTISIHEYSSVYLPILWARYSMSSTIPLKVHKIEKFFDSDFGICVISLLDMSKY